MHCLVGYIQIHLFPCCCNSPTFQNKSMPLLYYTKPVTLYCQKHFTFTKFKISILIKIEYTQFTYLFSKKTSYLRILIFLLLDCPTNSSLNLGTPIFVLTSASKILFPAGKRKRKWTEIAESWDFFGEIIAIHTVSLDIKIFLHLLRCNLKRRIISARQDLSFY